jgi:hypothetical protein
MCCLPLLSPLMYYSADHAALLPEDTAPLPMPETEPELLWLLAALDGRRRQAPVPRGPLPPDGSAMTPHTSVPR